MDYYVSFDSVKVGELQAEGVINVENRGKFAYIGGSETDNNAFLVKEGSMRVLTPFIESGDIEIVLDVFTPDWKQEEAYLTVKNYLAQGGKLGAIVAANDGTAFGSIQALEEYNLAGEIPISGQDAELTACQRIVEGTQTITVYSKKIKSVRLTMNKLAELGKKGIALTDGGYENTTEYLFTRLNAIKPEMVEEATTKAREVARKFAKDSNSKLGKIKKARQGQFSINARDKNNPHIKKVRVVSTIEYYLSD